MVILDGWVIVLRRALRAWDLRVIARAGADRVGRPRQHSAKSQFPGENVSGDRGHVADLALNLEPLVPRRG